MSIDRYIADDRPRPAPRCYIGRATPKAINQTCGDADSNAVVITLSIITCGVAFLAVFGGWSF
jgi:hypothetical protein